MPPLQLQQSLRRLIVKEGLDRKRQEIADAVGVTPGAISLYVRGKATPKLEVLVRLAEFFDVSLDLLVLGRQPAVERQAELTAALGYMDVALARVQDQQGRNARLVTRIGLALAKQINGAAERAASHGAPHGGVMDENDTLALERYSRKSIVVTTNLEYDVLHRGDTGEVPGRFAGVVADNVLQGRSYRFLLPSTARRRNREQWQPVVDSFCRTLLQQNVSVDQLMKNCTFNVLGQRVYSGCGLYNLDVAALRKDEPVLVEWLDEGDYLSDDGWVGYLIAPNRDMRADSLLDREHLTEARAVLDQLAGRQDVRRITPGVVVEKRSSARSS